MNEVKEERNTRKFFRYAGYFLLGLLVLAVLVFSLNLIFYGNQSFFYPWWLSIQRKSVEQSKSFTDANNNMLQTYIMEYSRLDTKIAEAGENEAIVEAYKAQQLAIVTKMCTQISTMATGTVNQATLAWLAEKGGCK